MFNSGEFGIVYKGRLDKTIGHVVHSEVVAIKTLKGIIIIILVIVTWITLKPKI